MKNFGKLAAFPEEIKLGEDILDEKGNIIQLAQTVKIMVLKDDKGVEWHDLFKKFPHKFYIAIDDNKRIISMTDDPEQSQIAGYELIGVDDNYGETFGQGGSVYGKLWDGEKIVAPAQTFPSLTARQFWQAALMIGVKEEDLVNGVADEKSPFYVADEKERESVLIDITKSTTFSHDFPLLEKMAAVANMPKEKFDTLWRWAARME